MDVNAGAYLGTFIITVCPFSFLPHFYFFFLSADGIPLDVLAENMFELTLRVASGERTAGEKAQHSQVQIWRDWALEHAEDLTELREKVAQTHAASFSAG